MIKAGQRNSETIIGEMRKKLSQAEEADIEYISIVDTEALEQIEKIENEVLAAVAVRFGKARLIDNIVVDTGSSKV